MSSTKDILISNIKDWIAMDQEIHMLQNEIKQRRTRKKQLTDTLVDIMKTNEIDCFDINNGKILYTRNKTRLPMSKKLLIECLTKHLSDSNQESVNELTEFILESREIRMTDKIRYKCPK